MHRRVMEITGRDPLPYGIEPNRQALEELIQGALEQKIIDRPVTVEELFPSNTHALVG
jgi:4,5-dihydroxyphthalate decarboxylase